MGSLINDTEDYKAYLTYVIRLTSDSSNHNSTKQFLSSNVMTVSNTSETSNYGTDVEIIDTVCYIWELTLLQYHGIMVTCPCPFLVVFNQLFS